jgi:nucleoside 2-deoxyribosyltransferase
LRFGLFTKQKLAYYSYPRSNDANGGNSATIEQEALIAKKNKEKAYFPQDKKEMDADKATLEFYRDLEAMKKAEVVHFVWRYPDPDLLFELGMAVALGKKIVIDNEVERTQGKSHSNVILDIAGGKTALPEQIKNNTKSFIDDRSEFMICPVRNAPQEIVERLREHKKSFERKGGSSYYPGDQTEQVDPEGGINIVRQNLAKMMEVAGVQIFWTGSTGSLFDLGTAFALGKDIINVVSISSENGVAVLSNVKMTTGGSYENLMLKLNGDFREKVSAREGAILDLMSYLR